MWSSLYKRILLKRYYFRNDINKRPKPVYTIFDNCGYFSCRLRFLVGINISKSEAFFSTVEGDKIMLSGILALLPFSILSGIILFNKNNFSTFMDKKNDPLMHYICYFIHVLLLSKLFFSQVEPI